MIRQDGVVKLNVALGSDVLAEMSLNIRPGSGTHGVGAPEVAGDFLDCPNEGRRIVQRAEQSGDSVANDLWNS